MVCQTLNARADEMTNILGGSCRGNRDTISNVQQIAELAKAGFTDWDSLGVVSVRSNGGDLLIFNYTKEAEFAGEWNAFERLCRGLVINKVTGEIVARPFDKFFNWGQGGRSTSAKIKSITEKCDGSMGTIYRENGEYKVTTRGSFESDQSYWATKYLKENVDLSWLSNEITPICEVVYPENKIVVNYGDLEGLFLLALRNRFTGEYLPLSEVHKAAELSKQNGKTGFYLPKVYDFKSPDEIIAAAQELSVNQEGWVVEFADGVRFKFKGAEYLEMARMLRNVTKKSAFAAVLAGNVDEYEKNVPEEYLPLVQGWVADIEARKQAIYDRVDRAFDDVKAHAGTTRKDTAVYILTHYKEMSAFLFLKLDNRSLDEQAYKEIGEELKKERKDELAFLREIE